MLIVRDVLHALFKHRSLDFTLNNSGRRVACLFSRLCTGYARAIKSIICGLGRKLLTESNGEFLRKELDDAKLADALMTDYRTAPIDEELKELLYFAEKVARDASQVTPDDIARVRSAGFSDRAVLDGAHVAGFFS